MSFVVTAIAGGSALALGATVGTAALVGLGAGAVYNMNEQQKKANELQQQAQQQAVNQAAQQSKAVEMQAQAQANQRSAAPRSADAGAALAGAQQAAAGAGSGTLLTGPQGVDPASLTLGKNTLLGM